MKTLQEYMSGIADFRGVGKSRVHRTKKSEYPDKLSLKKRRLKAAYDMEYLKKLIT